MLAVLNDLDVFDIDICNEYLNSPYREKIWTKAGPEFGSQQGCVMLIVRALYGLNSSVASWREIVGRDSGQGRIWLHIHCRRQGCLD